jgi:hypothetical protein
MLALGAITASGATVTAKQASLDEHQDACTDAGGTLTSWHFIINQIRPITNAPASITVTWSNGDSAAVPLDRTSGPVAHYNVDGSDTHTLIVSATADIYDGWTDQFNLSSVECAAGEPDACTELDGRTVIELNVLLGGAFFGLDEESSPVAVDIAAGTYTVTLGSFDDHVTHPGQNQDFEQWFARFETADGAVESNPISDLPDEPITGLSEEVGTITFTSNATSLTAVHLLAGQPFLTPESIMATCVALDPALD